jgi:thymidylate synthase
MANAYFSRETLDDVMRLVVEEIRAHGDGIHPSKGPATELIGALLEVTNPRARLSRTETRGKLFSSLGELCWYLAKSKDLSFISYYIPQYKEYADGSEIFGGYGPRLFDWRGLNQFKNVRGILTGKPDSRQAVIQLFDAPDILYEHKDVPCTCTLQFMLRHGKLHMFANMRSNDVFLGLPHDVFCFTMLQEVMARSLAAELGTYKHAIGSLHLYDTNIGAAQQFLDEGWQATDAPMPPMPNGDPWPAIGLLLKAESDLRTTGVLDDGILTAVDPYWADLVRLLQVFRLKKIDRDAGKIREVRQRIVSKVYLPFVDKALSEMS